MRLVRLEIQNFRRFASAALEFPDGLIGVVGANGAGKSTLLEAVAWALFGHEAARTGKDHLKRRGAPDDAPCEVIVAFTYDGSQYEVKRSLLGKNLAHQAELVVNGKVVVPAGAQSHKEATRYLERAFHLDKQAFFTSVVARQRELAALSDMTAGARQKTLLGMLRIDAVDEAITRARQRKREAKQRLLGVERGLEDEASLQKRVEQLAADEATGTEQRDRLVVSVAGAEKTAAEARRKRDALGAAREAHAEARAREAAAAASAEGTRQQADRAREDLAAATRAGRDAEALRPRVALLDGKQTEVDRLTEAVAQAEAAAAQHAAVAEARAEVTQAERALADAQRILADRSPARRLLERVAKAIDTERAAEQDAATASAGAQAEVAAARRDGETVSRQLATLVALGPDSPCPTCTRPLLEHFAPITASFEKEKEAHNERAATAAGVVASKAQAQQAARTRLAELRERHAEVQAKVEEFVRAEQSVAAAEAAVAAATARLQKLTARVPADGATTAPKEALAAARAEVRALQDDARRLDMLVTQAAQRDAATARLEAALEALKRHDDAAAAARKDREALGFDAAAFNAAVAAADGAEATSGRLRIALAEGEGHLRALAERRQRLRDDQERNARLLEEAREARADVSVLDRLAEDKSGGVLAEFRDHLVARVRPVLSFHASETFRDLTDGKYDGLELDADYALVVVDEGDRFALERYSGGETDLANLCLRLAVSRVIAERAGGGDFQLIALDEVFGSQDATRKAAILRGLAALATRFRQILVISHIEDVKDAVEHVVRVQEDAAGVATVTLE